MQTVTQCCCPLKSLAAGCWVLFRSQVAEARPVARCEAESTQPPGCCQVLNRGMAVLCSHSDVHPPDSSLSLHEPACGQRALLQCAWCRISCCHRIRAPDCISIAVRLRRFSMMERWRAGAVMAAALPSVSRVQP